MNSLVRRVEALEGRRARKTPRPFLRVVYREGESSSRVADLEAQALAIHAAKHGAPRTAPLFCHRVLVAARDRGGGGAHV